MGVSKNNGTPKSSILIGLSIINHLFWGTPIFGNTHIFVVHIHRTPNVTPHHLKRSSKFSSRSPGWTWWFGPKPRNRSSSQSSFILLSFQTIQLHLQHPKVTTLENPSFKVLQTSETEGTWEAFKNVKRLTNLSKDVPEFLGLTFFVGFMEKRWNCGNPAISITMWGIPHPFAICHSLWGSKVIFLVGHAIGNHSTPGLVSLYTDNA